MDGRIQLAAAHAICAVAGSYPRKLLHAGGLLALDAIDEDQTALVLQTREL